MNSYSRIFITLLVLLSVSIWPLTAVGQTQAGSIASDKIVALDSKLSEAVKSASAARKKLSIRRVIRAGVSLLKEQSSAPNRYEVLSILFRSQQSLLTLDKTDANRKAFLATCKKLAAAPNEYAALRFDADLLLTQAQSARQGGGSHARSDALRPLIVRYRDTEVEAKVIRVAMLMALEFGNTKLVNDLRKVVAQRFPGDIALIKFQREHLAGQVFGAPFCGTFEGSDGKQMRFPMDSLGTTTGIYFWSKHDSMQDFRALAAAWKKAKAEFKLSGRYQFVSMNMDDLPDAGEGIVRGLGLDWPALKMPKGKDNPIYQAYVNRMTPTIMVLTPSGYAALYESSGGGTGSEKSYARWMQSMQSRVWANARYASQKQSIFAGDFFVMDPQEAFNPALPAELKALASGADAKPVELSRSDAYMPEDKLRAIQACFIEPPLRYRTPHEEVIANYKKAEALCRAAIAAHPQAPDLWIVRNRLITALMGLWKTSGDHKQFAAAAAEAKVALKSDYPSPSGTNVVAQLCLAREQIHASAIDAKQIIKHFIEATGGQKASGPSLAAAALLALDIGDRMLHEQYRRSYLDQHAENPTMWTVSAFLLDRYHRHWMYQPPYLAGGTFERREKYFLALGTPEDAQRTFTADFKTLDGKTVNIPEFSKGKWTVISFVHGASANGYLKRYAAPVVGRPFDDVQLIAAVMEDDAATTRKLLEALNKPYAFPTLLVPDGIQNPIVRKLGILGEDHIPGQRLKNNILILRPDGSIAASLSGLTMSAQYAFVIQAVIEWQDEKNVDDALARGDLKEAQRLAFAYAPPIDPSAVGEKKIVATTSNFHLRSRAKVYQAMGDLKAALADAQQAYLAVNIKAGHISMRTEDLEKTEALKASIVAAMKAAEEDRVISNQ